MADSQGVTPISVPDGGGALKGIGETFQPDLHTGTANLSVPIPLPPGRGSLTPSLTLAYSSGSGNGPFGLGWSLAVPRISRRTDRSVPIYDDGTDVFVLSGAEELAPVPVPLGEATPADLPDGATALRYRPRTESGFARIVHVTGPTDDYWDVWSRDGLRSRYGTRQPADAGAEWSDPAAIVRPDGRVFAWLLSATRDTLGNRIAYGYVNDGGPQRYLQSVSYADYGDPTAPSYAVTVALDYGDPADPDAGPRLRPDPFSDRRPGFELRTNWRASRVAITTLASDGSPATSPTTTVDLTYLDQTALGPVTAGVSLLSSILVSGHDPAVPDPQSLPPLTFTYQDWDPGGRHYQPIQSGAVPHGPLGGTLDLVDLFSDGLPSMVDVGGTNRYWRNRGAGALDQPRMLAAIPSGAALGSAGTLMSDVNGDGRPELVVTAGGRTTVWSLSGTAPAGVPAGFDPKPVATTAVPTFGYTDPQVRLLDLNGDRIVDLLVGGVPPSVATGDGAGGFTGLRPLPGAPPPATDLADPHVRTADMTGDGLDDLVLIYDGAITYWPNLGHSVFGPAVRMTGAPRLTDTASDPGVGYDPKRLLTGDLTGDGTADLVYIADGSLTIWLNQSGNGYAAPLVVRGTPRVDRQTSVRLADWNGTGFSGVLFTGIGVAGTWAFLDLTGGVKPYLMTGMDNHRGAITALAWSTSTAFAVADRNAGRPWTTTLPFPVHVVTRTTTVDVFADTTLTSTFAYHDGYWDPADREFRGFGRVEHTDALAPTTSPAPVAPLILPLDPLTPAAPLPAGFDPSEHGNLLANGSFDDNGGPATTQTALGAASSAAPGWTVWNDTSATTSTELLASTLPQGKGGLMLHVSTDAARCGLVQPFHPPDGDPAAAQSSAWVKIVRGAVGIGTGDGGDTDLDVTCDQTGQWIFLQAGNGRSPANEFVVYAAGDGGAEFYVDHAWVSAPDIPPGPVDGPPIRTVSWFHLGPVGPAMGEWSDLDPSGGYWVDDPPLLPYLDQGQIPTSAEDPAFRPALREALRGLRGRLLRTELYAQDGDPAHGDRPYEVHDSAFEVVPVLDGRESTDPTWLANPVVTVREVLTRSTAWDRGDDPLTRLTATTFDDFDRPVGEVTCGVTRGRDPRDTAGGPPCLATVTATTYCTRDDATLFRLDLIAGRTRHEAVDPGTGPVTDFLGAALTGSCNGELCAVELNHYDGDPFQGLDVGLLGDHGLSVRTEHLVLTRALLDRVTEPAVAGGTTADPIPYLTSDGSPPAAGAWPGYPPEFQTAVSGAPATRGALLGYLWHDADGLTAEGYYAQSGRVCYDVQTPVAGQTVRGLPVASRDAYGGETTTVWDTVAQLLPSGVTNPIGLKTTASYDFRVLKPDRVTDPNQNITAVGYTPLGLPAWTARLGKAGGTDGDTIDQPAVTYSYDLTAYDEALAGGATARPLGVTTARRVDHRWTLVIQANSELAAKGKPPLTDAEIADMFPDTEEQDHPDRFIRTVEFTDGIGRLLQTRTQADEITVGDVGLPDDTSPAASIVTADAAMPDGAARVVVSGWKIYDNKGHPVTAYEPFFDTGYDYREPTPVFLAGLASVVQHYDPRGRPTVTVAPDGSQTRVVYGTPSDPRKPADAAPNPWETYSYGADDNAGRTHPTRSLDIMPQWDTPASALVDALGRTVQSVRRGLAADVVTTNSYDIDGHLISVTDPLGRQCAVHLYDCSGCAWLTWLLDAGATRIVYDAAGGIVERRDDKGALTLADFDRAHRPARLWAGDRSGQPATVRRVTVYGDDAADSDLTPEQAITANALGRAVTGYDEAGMVTIAGYDLDGNPLAAVRRVLRPDLLVASIPGVGQWTDTAYPVDWQPAPGQTMSTHGETLLDPTDYRTDGTFDALGRRTSTTAPVDATGLRAELTLTYGRGGGLTGVAVDGVSRLKQIVYDAHGRRSLALLGNDVLLRYRHDPRTFRLRRLHAQHCTYAPPAWHTDGDVLQDTNYRYDPGGNLLTLGDRTPRSGLPVGVDPVHSTGTDSLDRIFGYDPLDRLITATGRETDVTPNPPWLDNPRGIDYTLARAYIETYDYDLVGNVKTLDHDTGVAGIGAYTRTFAGDPAGNRLETVAVSGGTVAAYSYDAAGNTLTEADSRFFEWDHANRLATFRNQAGSQGATAYHQYRYDAAGERVVKFVRRSAGPDEMTIYIGGFERTLVWNAAGGTTPYDELHLTDHGARFALIQRGNPHPDDGITGEPIRYQIGDHLGSVTATLDVNGAPLNREEYLPHGETSFGSYARKRYRYTGKERDADSGLAYHGARYYASWLGRWLSTDPAGHAEGTNNYTYCGNSPGCRTDASGCQSESAEGSRRPVTPQIDSTRRITSDRAQEFLGRHYGLREQAELTHSSPLNLRQFKTEAEQSAEQSPFAGRLLGELGFNAGWHLAELATGESTTGSHLSRRAKSREVSGDVLSMASVVATVGDAIGLIKSAVGYTRGTIGILESARVASNLPPARIYSAQVLHRAVSVNTDNPALAFRRPDMTHNFPMSFDQVIFQEGRRTQVSDSYVTYSLPGEVQTASRETPSAGPYWERHRDQTGAQVGGDAMKGEYVIGVRPSPSGRVEVIVHRQFEH